MEFAGVAVALVADAVVALAFAVAEQNSQMRAYKFALHLFGPVYSAVAA